MQKIKTTLTILIFILLFIAGLSLVNNLYSGSPTHISQQGSLIAFPLIMSTSSAYFTLDSTWKRPV